MYYSYVKIEYVAMSFSPARTDLALKLLREYFSYWVGHIKIDTALNPSQKPQFFEI